MKNLDELVRETAAKVVDVQTMPACIYIESVHGCPYSCAMCRYHFSKPTHMPAGLLHKVSAHFDQLEVLAIQGAGEPLLGDLEYFVQESLKHDFVLAMNTTGFFLTKKVADDLARVRLSIRFSIHAGTKDTYQKIMGNNFDTVLDNIGYLVAKSRESGTNSDFWFSFIVMKENQEEVEDFLRLAHRIGIRHVRFMELEPNPRTIRGVKLPNRDFRFSYFEQNHPDVARKFQLNLPRYRALADELGITIEPGSMGAPKNLTKRVQTLVNAVVKRVSPKLVFFPLRRRQGRCVAPWLGQLIITQDGECRLCCPCNYSVGNVNEATLEAIWKGESLKAIRKSFNQGYFPRMCGYCRGLGVDEYPRNSQLAGLPIP